MIINKKDNKYISQLSDEELKEMMIFLMDETCRIQKDRYLKDRVQFILIRDIFWGPAQLIDKNTQFYREGRSFFEVLISDYNAFVHRSIDYDASDLLRKFMYRKFGKEYLDDLEVFLREPFIQQLNYIDDMLNELQAGNLTTRIRTVGDGYGY